ncbi:MAG TPA: protein-export chaperone SecB [Rubrivivax sp.]|nr:protein-export chaperone SecB [Rubrivivax sp.]
MSDQQPVFSIEKIYVKDLSIEVPNAPQVFLERESPSIEVQIQTNANAIGDGMYEVALTVTVSAKRGETAFFLVEVVKAGIFQIRNVPQEQMQGIISIVCPQMIYPYLRAIVSDVCTRAGFPPILLTEVNFQAMFEAQQAQAAAQGNGGSRIITSPN